MMIFTVKELSTTMLSRLARPTGSTSYSACAVKLSRCISGEAAQKQSHAYRLSEEVFQREHMFGAHNYHPLPVALCKAQGRFPLQRHLTHLTLCALTPTVAIWVQL